VFLIESISYVFGEFMVLGTWNQQVEIAVSVVLAVILGGIFAYFSNNDKFHELVRKIGVSKETSYPSEWFGEFSKRISYVVLHLDGERRIYGWPIEWPSRSDEGHFSLLHAAWLDGNEETPLSGVEAILIPASSVTMVEFMKKIEEDVDG